MPDEPDDRPTQHTEKGLEIPVPTREEVFRDLEKVTKPKRRPSTSRVRHPRRPKEQ